MEKETTNCDGLMVDFVKIQEIVPENGYLTISFRKTGNKLNLLISTKHNAKDAENKLKPFSIGGTPEELNEHFENGIREVAAKEQSLADVFNTRQREIDKKIEEAKKKPGTPGKTAASTSTASKQPAKKDDPKPSQADSSGETENPSSTDKPEATGNLFSCIAGGQSSNRADTEKGTECTEGKSSETLEDAA